MNRQLAFGGLRVLLYTGVTVYCIARGGWYLLWLLVLPGVLWGLYLQFRPGGPARPAARFTAAGEHRVVLQVVGNTPIAVLREIRRTRGLGLREAKELMDAAPVVIAEGLSEQSAELVADRLRAAGARALAAPIGESG